mmetsp:Transcript_30210/g.34421  ORF Transcript_30210/g.34421 Transcript_30210/m.34421 type:complete len:185 (-) Transcript_30210:872-1426(-)
MANSQTKFCRDSYCDAIVHCYVKSCNINTAAAFHRVPARKLRNALMDLNDVNSEKNKHASLPLKEDQHYHQCFCWATKYTGASGINTATVVEKQEALLCDATQAHLVNMKHTLLEKGVSGPAHFRYQKKLAAVMCKKNMKKIRKDYKNKVVTKDFIKRSINKISFVTKSAFQKTRLHPLQSSLH